MSASLNNIVDVNVEVSNPSVVSSDFNLGLIIGTSATSTIATNSVKVYTYQNYLEQMVADGYKTTDSEYVKASIYFSQNPHPSQVAIGKMASSGNPADALTAMRNVNDRFYSVCFANTITTQQIQAVAAAVESFSIPTVYYFSSNDSNILATGTTNIFATLLGLKYTRTFGFYSTDANIDAAVVGIVSGLNSMEVNSAYTLAYKQLSGVTVSNLNDSQISNITSYNGNAYSTFGNRYNFIYPGISFGGYHADELYLIDAAKTLIQLEAVSGMTTVKKVPMTEDGVGMITTFVSNACERLFNIGLIASGIWRGDTILGLNTGDAIENGYSIQSGSVSDMTASERLSRTSPPIYVCLLASSAIEHVVIRVFVNR